jgi:pyruvate/2-oxoglutarate/acetoin dehydrogenase E1 component/TPP-dependent pyruvate/acetoin dehydrogenase alpha subunit
MILTELNSYFCFMDNQIYQDTIAGEKLSFDRFREEVLKDFKAACESREASLLGRREVLTGKAKFGIFGDGKEIAQIAMAKFFRPGDFRAGYYRDQTWMFASGLSTIEQFFAQLYSNPDARHDPFSAGRQMNAHFATPFVREDGTWMDLADRRNVSADIAPTAGQMPRALGLAFASQLFRQSPALKSLDNLSHNGNEVCFCTIGDASTSEGHFWETMNAAGVLQVPLAVFVWDDGYGISVPKKYQTVKGSVSEALKGFQQKDGSNGIDIYRVKAWDYAGMCEVFERGIRKTRETHTPALFHVEEVTQPQGHSTSGSHERYKTPERLEWEREWDCLPKMREWLLENALATSDELDELLAEAKKSVRASKQAAWENYITPIREQVSEATSLLRGMIGQGGAMDAKIQGVVKELSSGREPLRKDVMHSLSLALQYAGNRPEAEAVKGYYGMLKERNRDIYNTYLYNEGPASALRVEEIPKRYEPSAPMVNGFEILNRYFDALFAHNPKVVAFGEDVGKIGDVNQGFAGLQEKYGKERIFDTGIRELTIMGQGLGLALRGLRPIAEIQYLDYLLYGLEPLSDDVATTHYRTRGQQSCPLIVRTRGHRLEGVWHSGSPLGMVINALRGLYVCVPRNMTQAVGMYNTLLKGNDPAIMIECLNGYRLKEQLPANLIEYTVPLGIPEIVRKGEDITVVSYGSTLRILQDAATILEQWNIHCEIVDVQTLLPFDRHHLILDSLKKTSRILFVDEDVPGGAVAYMFNEVIEKQGAYRWLDGSPRTLTAKAHRPPYSSDGDYFSKPNVDEVVETIKAMMEE